MLKVGSMNMMQDFNAKAAAEFHNLPGVNAADESDSFEVVPMVDEFNDASVRYSVNGQGLEITTDQAEAFGIALVAAAHRARQMAKEERMNWPMEGFPFPNAIYER
jgi:hypothetical protein